MSELQLVVEESLAELASVSAILDLSVQTNADNEYLLDARARIAAANAIHLYISAFFERAVRELAKAFLDAAILRGIPESRAEKIKAGAWERVTDELKAKPMGARGFDEANAETSLSILTDCLSLSVSQSVAHKAVYNRRNLRPKELNSVFARVGVPLVSDKIGRSREFKDFFGVSKVSEAQDEFIRFLEEFYVDRNDVMHELEAMRSRGQPDVARYIDFFEAAISRAATVLQAELDSL